MALDNIPGPVAGRYLPPFEIIFVILALVSLGLRFATRIVVTKKRLRPDDYFAGIGAFCSVLLVISHLLAVHYGLGHHDRDISYAKTTVYLPWSKKYEDHYLPLWIIEFVQPWAFSIGELFVKISTLMFYRQFLPYHKTIISFGIFFIFWSVALAATVNILLVWQNTIVMKRWLAVSLICVQVLTLVSNIMLFLLPIPVIRKLIMTRRKKFGILALLSLCLIICIIALVRIKLLMDMLINYNDMAWYGYAFYFTISLESSLCVICVCLPFTKPILKHMSTCCRHRSNNTIDIVSLRPQVPPKDSYNRHSDATTVVKEPQSATLKSEQGRAHERPGSYYSQHEGSEQEDGLQSFKKQEVDLEGR